jgi:hypothetical protein
MKWCEYGEQFIEGTRKSDAWKTIKAVKTSTGNKVILTNIPHKEWITHYQNLPEEQKPQLMNWNLLEEWKPQFLKKLHRKKTWTAYTLECDMSGRCHPSNENIEITRSRRNTSRINKMQHQPIKGDAEIMIREMHKWGTRPWRMVDIIHNTYTQESLQRNTKIYTGVVVICTTVSIYSELLRNLIKNWYQTCQRTIRLQGW